MDLRQLHALVAVAEHGTFSAAAHALNTVQSNVSAHIARLEKELGAVLVDRVAGRLTEEGMAVVERARRINAELQAVVADVAAVRHEVTGVVHVGMIGTTARWLVPRMLDATRARHPKVAVVVVDATSTSLGPRLLNGSLDLAVVNLPLPGPELGVERLFDEDLLLFVPDDHPLADVAQVALSDLTDLELLLTPPGTALRDQVEDAARTVGATLTPRAELDGVRLIASLAIEGYAPAILPASAVPPRLQHRTRPVVVDGLPRRPVGIALRRRGLPSAPARALLTLLRDLVQAETATSTWLHAPGE